jgi:hypothetical protein
MSLHSSDTLLEAMRDPAFYPHTTAHNIQVIHTHISTVFLAGEFAYKIKKPVNFGFLDFTQLTDRKHFCEEELRLNRRLAPNLYLDAVPILYKNGHYQLGEPNTATCADIIEYAVKMRQFDPQQQLDQLLTASSLPVGHMDTLAHHISRFHQNIEVATPNSHFGLPLQVLAPMQQNFVLLRAHLHDPAILKRLSLLENWTQQEYSRLYEWLLQRKHGGYIRACHGDMHLGNIAVIEGEITIFDGIEFNEDLRWIDTASEIAFLVMDLEYRNAPSHAHRLLNCYLETGGDYSLLAVLDFYIVYRAMVRAKVNALRLEQNPGEAERAIALQQCADYLTLAEKHTHPTRPALFITHGLSGSGKSYGCRQLSDAWGFIQLRSDVERKRLLEMQATQRPTEGLNQGIYSANMTARTYDRLAELSTLALENHFSVVVDATFLDAGQRQRFRQLAQAHHAAYLILHFSDTPAQLEANILRRQQANTDASDADISVLHQQLEQYKPLQDDEPCVTVPPNEGLPLLTLQAYLTV